MAELAGSAVSGFTGVTKEYPVASGVTVTSGDFVYTTGGRVTNASITGKTLLGIVLGQGTDPSNHKDTQTAVGDVAGTVKVLVCVEPNAKFVVTNDNIGTTFDATLIGNSFDVTGNTGAQMVDTSTSGTTTGQLECIGFGYNGDNTKGLFIINEHKYKDNA